jgi:hypothetical protein
LSGNNALTASCAPESNGPENVYHVDVTSPSLLVARLSGLAAGTLGDPVLSLRSQCDQNNSETACSARSYDLNNPFVIPPNPAILRAPLNPEPDPVTGMVASRYTLVVDGVEVGEEPNFQLNIELRPLAAPPINDRCDRVTALSFTEGLSVVDAYLDQAQNDMAGCGDGGPDVMYSFTVEEASRVLIQAISKPAEFPVIIALSETCGQSNLACGFASDQILNPGEYFITLAGMDDHSRGLVELQVVLDPLPQAADNETCEQAIALDGDSGTVTGNTQGSQDDYTLSPNNNCTRYPSNAPDVVYSIQGNANIPITFTATPQLGWDLSLYLLSSCENADPFAECLAGQDGALTETVTYTPSADGEIYIVIDGSNSESGSFELSWQKEAP